MMHKLIRYAALAAAVGLGACNLAIDNPGAGDTKRVLGTPNDAENLISTYYKRWSAGVYGTENDIEGMANVMSLQNFSSLANDCQNSRTPFSGATNSNAPGNTCGGNQATMYQVENEVARVASSFIAQIDNGALVIGTSDPKTDARVLRDRAFAEFERGLALGYLALIYDSSAVISPTMSATAADCLPVGGTCIGKLRPYTEVRDSALAAFQRALDATNAPVITGNLPDGFPFPNSWLPSTTNWTAANFTKLIRSYRARITANVPRTPAERAAVNWASIVADAQAGITADHDNITSTTAGPTNSWRDIYEAFTTWHQMTPFVIGMGDVSGSYASFIATPLAGRGAGNTGFFMVTPDQRFPQGATRAAQQADFAITQCATAATQCKRYYVNRPAANDQFSGAGWGWSNYDFVRFNSWDTKGDAGSARNGATPIFMISELNLIQAEGQYRLGNYAAAAALVNLSRAGGVGGTGLNAAGNAVGGGLPPIVVADGCGAAPTSTCGTPVPGGANCVPKIPVGPAFTSIACGNLWEALKYEKRIETAYTAYVNWYLDERGWGDLPQNTALFWAVPYQDLQARGTPVSAIYGAGPGAGNAPNSTAGASTYGW